MERELTHISLFSGIGGLDLAAEWAGFRTVGQCEWADYPRAVLEKHWPGLPRWRDIRDLTGVDFREKTGLEHPTVVSGGFPCRYYPRPWRRGGHCHSFVFPGITDTEIEIIHELMRK